MIADITMNGSPIPININTYESKGDLAAYIVIPRLSGSGAVITFSTWNLYGGMAAGGSERER